MPLFQYHALNPSGQRVAGVLAGANEQAVLAELETRQLVPVSIAPKRERSLALRRGASARVMAATYQQLADLLKAGVPLMRGLRLLGARKSQPRLSKVFKEMADAVAEGEELAEAMAKHPNFFPKVHVAMVRAGEKGGFLEAVFARLAQFVNGQAELRGKLVGNLVYPAMLVVFGAAVLGVIFGFFVPMFRPMFEKMPSLPAVTKLVFAMSTMVAAYGPVTLAVVGAAVAGLWWAGRRPDVRRKLTELRTNAPVVGPLVRAIAAARFCRMLGTMLGNGIPMLAAMQIAKDAAGNVLMEEAIERASEAVRAGQALATPLSESGLFSDDVIEMISVAESANNLDDVLITIAETIEGRIDRLLSSLVRLIEPLLLMAIAGVVVLVAMALILPMTQMRSGF